MTKRKANRQQKKGANRVLKINTWFQQENGQKQGHQVIRLE